MPEASEARILLVGAGAVGQVYARHLQRGGATVSFFVRPRYREELEHGVWMWPLNQGRQAIRFEAFEVLSSLTEVAASTWDQVWLCVSSPALRQGDWLDGLIAAIGDATLVTLQPGLEDRALLLARLPAERLVSGMITFIAWAAPLPGEQLSPPGIMVWVPPLSPSPFSGDPARVEAIVNRLRSGGLAAREVADVAANTAIGSGVLLPFIASLETAGWTFAGFRAGGASAMAVAAIREAVAVSAAYHAVKPPFGLRLLAPWMLRLASRLVPRVAPFDVETYLRYHFTKVGDQTRAGLETWISEGARRGLSVEALRRLRAALS